MGNESSSFEDEKVDAAAAKQLAHFDHAYKAALHTLRGTAAVVSVFGAMEKEDKEINLNCTAEQFELELEAVSLADRKKAVLPFLHITEVGFDHDRCQVKFTIREGTDASEEDREGHHSSTMILKLPNLVEFEHEIKLRFNNLANSPAGMKMKIPPVNYVGMFAGSTKPKPFQRKRPNISSIPSGKLPPLSQMRETAFSRHSGSYAPCHPGESRRMELAVQHIFEGYNTFSISVVKGDQAFSDKWHRNSIFLVTEGKIEFRPYGLDSQPIEILFDDVESWEVSDNETAQERDVSGIYIDRRTSEKRLYFGFKYIRDVKHTLEFFWNKHQIDNDKPVMPGSTHGRPLVTVYTLSGEEPAGPAPEGHLEIEDMDGIAVKPGQMVSVGNRTQFKSHKHISIGAPTHDTVKLPHENKTVKMHWRHVVKHQGWLLKQGGVGIGASKKWQKRYFVLYSTSQGHFLIYYSDLLECPMYTTEHAERNVIDMAKAVFIRPGSTKHGDTPPHSFDLVTIEREFTLCAETPENLQKWLHMLTRAVDEDVAILPDEDIMFKVKAKVDPLGIFNPMDYSTTVLVSANCVNVTSPQTELQPKNKCTWIYTDFYKWSLISQNHKLALMVSVFTDASFKRRLEFHFRTKEAVRLATAIEFFIEKFMSVMHIMLEVTPASEQPPDPPKASAPVEQERIPDVNLLDLNSNDNETFTANVNSSSGDGFSSGFGDDPFFSTSSKDDDKGALTDAQVAQHKAWLLKAVFQGGGPLYDDGSLQVACKVEVRGSQARLTLYYHNKCTVSAINDFTVTMSDTNGFLRAQFGQLPPSLSSGSQVEQQVMVECMKPSDVWPLLSISYREGNGSMKRNDLKLPLHLTLFNDPLSLNMDDFNNRWNMLSSPGQEATACVIRKTSLSDEEVDEIFVKALRFSHVPGSAPNCLNGAASLRTGATNPGSGDKITLGCLVKIENSGATINIACRTVHPAATSALCSSVKHLLAD